MQGRVFKNLFDEGFGTRDAAFELEVAVGFRKDRQTVSQAAVVIAEPRAVVEGAPDFRFWFINRLSFAPRSLRFNRNYLAVHSLLSREITVVVGSELVGLECRARDRWQHLVPLERDQSGVGVGIERGRVCQMVGVI